MSVLRWTSGFTLGFGGHLFGRLQVRDDPTLDVLLAKIPRELEDEGARIEIRSSDGLRYTRLFVWEDRESSPATETFRSIGLAKERAEVVFAEMLARLHARKGRSAYR